MRPSLLVLATGFAALVALETPARAEGDDGYATLTGAGIRLSNVGNGVSFSAYLYPRSDSSGIDNFYLDATAAGTGLDFDFGFRVYKRLTLGIDFGIDDAKVSGAGVPDMTGKTGIQDYGVTVGWIALQTPRLLVHPLVFLQGAGDSNNHGGSGYGCQVIAVARLVHLFGDSSAVTWLSVYANATFRAGSIKGPDSPFDYNQSYLVIGVTPLDFKW